MLRFTAWLSSFGLSMLCVGMLAGVYIVNYYTHDLPDYSSLSNYQPPVGSRVYDAEGQLLEEYATQKRIFTPIEHIPRKVIRGFLAAEDQDFYHHPGVDMMGVARAIVINIKQYLNDPGGMSRPQGASTITQQVVKNFFLTNERSLTRKIKEALLSFRISSVYSKDRILEIYLNEIYLGMGAYGITRAAQIYFDKSLQQLTTEEIALLAGMPKGPSAYDPRTNPSGALGRRNYVIGRMLEDGYITDAEAHKAQSSEIRLAEPMEDAVRVAAPFFTEDVRRELVERYGRKLTYKGGLYVVTTLQPDLQLLVEESLQDALIAYDRRHGWRGVVATLSQEQHYDWRSALAQQQAKAGLGRKQVLGVVLALSNAHADVGLVEGDPIRVTFGQMQWAYLLDAKGRYKGQPKTPHDLMQIGDVIVLGKASRQDAQWRLEQIPEVNGAMVVQDPQTGRVLAMSGGFSAKASNFNRATQAQRQPGSAFKPFVYMSALERGFAPNSMLQDAPIELSQGEGLPMWRPKNYGDNFMGLITLRTGLEKSRNLITVRLAQMIGIDAIAMIGQRLGIYGESIARNYSMVLGSQETTLMRIVNAYSMLANGGIKVSPYLIERIDGRDGTVLYRADEYDCIGCTDGTEAPLRTSTPPAIGMPQTRLVDERIAYQMTSLLRGVVQRGTATSLNQLGVPLAGKTGTTNDSRDVWFVGFSPDLVVGVYIGYDTPRSLGKKETGGRVALPAVAQFMQGYYTTHPKPEEFLAPQGIRIEKVSSSTGLVVLPWNNTGGATIDEAFLTGGMVFIPGKEGVAFYKKRAERMVKQHDQQPNDTLADGISLDAILDDVPNATPPSTQPVQPVVPTLGVPQQSYQGGVKAAPPPPASPYAPVYRNDPAPNPNATRQPVLQAPAPSDFPSQRYRHRRRIGEEYREAPRLDGSY